METWQLQDAKNRFSELVEKARSKGPQLVTRRGKPAVVVLSAEDYRKAIGKDKSALDILLSAPRVEDDSVFDRDQSSPREVDL